MSHVYDRCSGRPLTSFTRAQIEQETIARVCEWLLERAARWNVTTAQALDLGDYERRDEHHAFSSECERIVTQLEMGEWRKKEAK